MAKQVTGIVAKVSLGRGKKQCKHCLAVNGPRSYNCKSCGKPFTFKSEKVQKRAERVGTKEANKRVKWEELKKGDFIKVTRGGPYWLNHEGIRISLADKGVYQVVGVVPEQFGIQAYHVKQGGYSFLWMGPKTTVGNIVRRPHKIIRVKPKVKDEG
jgi:hypothetical protein